MSTEGLRHRTTPSKPAAAEGKCNAKPAPAGPSGALLLASPLLALAALALACAAIISGSAGRGPFFAKNADLLAVMGGSWEKVDLSPHDALNAALTASLSNETYVEGHSGTAPRERAVYWALAARPSVKTICEIGFNAGHSASLWLLANPTARVIMFDLWEHAYAARAEAFLKGPAGAALGIKNGADRLSIHKGDSRTTVRAFAGAFPSVKCDLLSVDGGHEHDIAVDDIANMAGLAAPGAILVVDDSNCDAHWCVDAAVDHHARLGTIKRLFAVAEAPVVVVDDEEEEDEEEEGADSAPEVYFVRGVTVAQYQNVPL